MCVKANHDKLYNSFSFGQSCLYSVWSSILVLFTDMSFYNESRNPYNEF